MDLSSLKLFKVIYFACILNICCIYAKSSECLNPESFKEGTTKFVNEIFQKYGKKFSGKTLTTEELTQLMSKLKIGEIRTFCEDGDAECLGNTHNDNLKKRDLPDVYNSSQHSAHWNSHVDNVSDFFLIFFFILFT